MFVSNFQLTHWFQVSIFGRFSPFSIKKKVFLSTNFFDEKKAYRSTGANLEIIEKRLICETQKTEGRFDPKKIFFGFSMLKYC